jgi:D-3-phosphoglycerate dehydrogenase
VYRRLLAADVALRRGEWLQWNLRPTSFELANKTLGLLGFGQIGRRVAEIAQAFQARVVYFDTVRAAPEIGRLLDATFLSFDELLSGSDVLSIHVPLTPRTIGMIGAAEIHRMKSSAVLINTARGGIVDDLALAAALHDGCLAGAGIDVFGQEPPPVDHPLLSAPGTVLTPHIAAGTSDGLAAKLEIIVPQLAWELTGCEDCLEILRDDAHRLAASTA